MIKIKLADPSIVENLHLKHFKTSVLNKINSEIQEAQNRKRLAKGKGSRIQKEGNTNLINLLKYLKVNVEKVLIGKREDLVELISEIEKYYYVSINKFSGIDKERKRNVDGRWTDSDFQPAMNDFVLNSSLYNHLDRKEPESIAEFYDDLEILKGKWQNHRKVLECIFDYDSFSEAAVGWSAYELADCLKVGVCPYCNRSFTTTLRKIDGQGKQTRPDFDHYYPKSRYQYLGVSLYNLIPSCAVCNRSMKGTVDFYEGDAIHPYDEEFLEVASFSTDFNYADDDSYKFLLGQSSKFKLTFNINTTDEKLRKKVENSINAFELERLYDSHRDIVVDIIKVSRMYTEERIKELKDEFDYIFNNEEEVLQSVFLNYMTPENLGKRPLAKLTQDISKELGLSIKINK